jgi:hypothetical protein
VQNRVVGNVSKEESSEINKLEPSVKPQSQGIFSLSECQHIFNEIESASKDNVPLHGKISFHSAFSFACVIFFVCVHFSILKIILIFQIN